MALINCPECGKEVSDRADICIHCGYPIKVNMDNRKVYAVKLLNFRGSNSQKRAWSKQDAEKVMEVFFGAKWKEANEITNHLPAIIGDGLEKETAQYLVYHLDMRGCTSEIVESEKTEFVDVYNYRIRKRMEEKPLDGKVHCPKCNGTDIDVIQKGYGLLRGFVGSNKPMNVCKKCGYRWEASGR